MRFSLVVASIHRTTELSQLFKSLSTQTHLDFEVVLVDQNSDQRLLHIVNKFSILFKIKHLRCKPGLSYARNIGISVAQGDIIAFPDDDAFYPENLLEQVNKAFLLNSYLSGLTGRCLDIEGKIAAAACDKNSGAVTRHNVWKRGVATTLFLQRQVIEDVGCFDEQLGLGAPTSYLSGEETDLVLRAISKGHYIEYDPKLIVFHPAILEEGTKAVYKAWSYGLGMGRVLKKHETNIFSVTYHILYPLLGAINALAIGKSNKAFLRFARSIGRLYGWKSPDHLLMHQCPDWIIKPDHSEKIAKSGSIKTV